MRRYLLLLAAALLLITALPVAAQVPPDVPADHWAVQAIRDMFARGIFVGYPDESFRGDRAVTRYELAVALSRLLEALPDDPDLSRFVTRTELQTTLQAYPTRTELQNTLQAYPTRTELQNTLQAYVTRTEFEQRLAQLATREDIVRLQRLVDELRTDLTALGVRVDEAMRRLTALETRMANLEERVARLEQEPGPGQAPGLVFNVRGGIVARDVGIGTPGLGMVNEFDRPLVNPETGLAEDFFAAGGAVDITIGGLGSDNLGFGGRIFAINEDITSTALDDFDVDLGLFIRSGMSQLNLGVFDAGLTPFTLANSSESILEQIPAFHNNWYFNGAKLDTNLGLIRLMALYSRTREEIFAGTLGDQYGQTLFAARAAVNPSERLSIGGNYVFTNDEFDLFIPTTIFPALKNRVWSVDVSNVIGNWPVRDLNVIAEYADSRIENLETGVVDTGIAYKAGLMVGPVQAYYLSIGGVDDPFFSYYGDPAAATLFNAHDPSMGALMQRFSFGQLPNLTYTDAFRFDLNNNIRGYGALVGLGRGAMPQWNDPVSPVLNRPENAGLFRVALGYERLTQIDPAVVFTTNGVDITTTVDDGVFQTLQASLALDLGRTLTLLGGFRQRRVTADGVDVVDDGVNPPAILPFDIDARQNVTSIGLALRLNPDSFLALEHLMIDYEEDTDPDFNSDYDITKATLSVRF